MQTTFALASLVAAVAAQAVTSTLTPGVAAPAGCSPDFSGSFEITAVNTTIVRSKRSLAKRACDAPGSLTIDLAGGILTDASSRTGYIASNFQFQFDGPPQAGALFTGGFSACSNGSLALGGSAVFYECLSGSFFNLYDRPWAPQCEPILIEILPCGSSFVPVSQQGDGQPTGGQVSQITDGQPQGTSVPVVTQITDGQPQGTSVPVVTQITDGQPQAASPIPITQISDGQPQIPSGLMSQMASPITQITDGQPQAPSSLATVAPITQITDGQPQAPTSTLAPITQISDGQPQVPTSTGAPISQISDGQVQAPNSTAPPAQVTPTASSIPVAAGSVLGVGSSLAALVAGIAALLVL